MGVPTLDAQAQIAVIENVLRDSIRPRLPSIQVALVIVDEKRCVLVLRIGRMNGSASSEWQWYAQLFQDGVVEFVDGMTFNRGSAPNRFHPNWIEQDLFTSFRFVRQLYRALEISGRISILASATGIRSYSLGNALGFVTKPGLTGHSTAVGRDPALFNEVTVDNMDGVEESDMKPIIEQVWRSGAYSRAASYDVAGNYIGYKV